MIDFNSISFKWNFYTYPWRPGKKILDFIANNYEEGDKVLILGSTKEFRKLFKNIDCTICDNSKEMIKELSVGNKEEKIIVDDWFNLRNGDYDLIVGDLVFFLFDEEKQKQLIKLLKNNLSNKGKIIIRYGERINNRIANKSFFIKKVIESYAGFENDLFYFNYISFELTFGLGYNFDDIYITLLNYNKKLANDFKNIFIKLLPYNNIKIDDICNIVCEYENYVLKTFYLTEEKILLINK